MKVGLIQYAPKWEAAQANIDILTHLLDGCGKDFDLLVFPEMTLSGFTMEPKKCAEDSSSIGGHFFSDIARASGADVFAGLIEQEHGRFFNTLAHYNGEGEITSRYRKMHPFSFAGEDQHYAPGTSPVVTRVGKTAVGLSICYDLRFPELYRIYAKERVPLMVNIANWPTARSGAT